MQEKRKGRLVGITVLGLVALAVAASAALGANTGPLIAFTPTAWDFGAGSTVSKDFVLTNTGRGATGVLGITLGGSSTPFSVTADGCTGKKLAANKSCSVTVQYAPTSATSQDSGYLFAFTNKPPLNESVFLTGGPPSP